MVVMTTNRDDLFKKFGPILLEALIKTLVEELNLTRRKIGMDEITPEDILHQIESHLPKTFF